MSKSSARDRNQFVGCPAPRPPRRGVCCKSEVKSAPGPHQTTGWSGAGMRTHAVSKPRHGQRYFYQGNNEEFLNFKHSTLSQRFYCINHGVSTRSKNMAPSRGKSRTLASTRLLQAIFSHWSLAPEPKQPPK